MVIRYAVKEDAQKFWNLMKALDQETTYMLYEPDERKEDLRMPQRVMCTSVTALPTRASTKWPCSSTAGITARCIWRSCMTSACNQ